MAPARARRRRDSRRRTLRAPRGADAEPGRGHDRARSRPRACCCCGVIASSPTRGAGRSRPAASIPARRPQQAAAREDARGDRLGAGSAVRRSCGTNPRTDCRIRCSTSSWPTARRTSGDPTTPASRSASSGSRVDDAAPPRAGRADARRSLADCRAATRWRSASSEASTSCSRRVSRARRCGRRPRTSSRRTRRARPSARTPSG